MTKAHRSVFRYREKTLDCYLADGAWRCAVQGEKTARGPFKSSGKAIEAGIGAVNKQHDIRGRRLRRGKKPSVDSLMRRAGQ